MELSQTAAIHFVTDPGDEMDSIGVDPLKQRRMVNDKLDVETWLELYGLCNYRLEELRFRKKRLERARRCSAGPYLELDRRIAALNWLIEEKAARTQPRLV